MHMNRQYDPNTSNYDYYQQICTFIALVNFNLFVKIRCIFFNIMLTEKISVSLKLRAQTKKATRRA